MREDLAWPEDKKALQGLNSSFPIPNGKLSTR